MTFPESGIHALGGQGEHGSRGGNGMVFIKGPDSSNGDLVIDGGGVEAADHATFIEAGYIFDNVILRNGARAIGDSGLDITGTLHITGGSVLSHSEGNEAGLVINAAIVQVDAGSAIDVTGRGYLGGKGWREHGRTVGNVYGSDRGAGGSYGGLGAGHEGRDSYVAYGDPANPVYLGSGGGAWDDNDGGNGGGRIEINATEAVIVDGAIRADGADSAGSAAGAGSGGSILVHTSRLEGTGVIEANGGGNGVGAAGGGGRVAIYLDYTAQGRDLAGLRNITAFAGHGEFDARPATAGTVFVKYSSDEHGSLYIDDNMVDADGELTGTAPESTPLTHIGFGTAGAITDQTGDGHADTLETDGLVRMVPGGLAGLRLNPDITQDESFVIVSNTENTITVETPNENGAAFEDIAHEGATYAGVYTFKNIFFRRGGSLVCGDILKVTDTVLIDEYGLLTHFDATPSFTSLLDLRAGNVVITETGRIDVTGRGYLGGKGWREHGRTVGNVYGSDRGAGGSYGGLGGSYDGHAPNGVYGSLTDPSDLGSGGGAWENYVGGDGGGVIFISAGSIEVNGAIRSNGEESAGSAAGDGSGGTINITTGTLSGTGVIEANGGGQNTGVGGGGGRIAIRYSTSMTFPESGIHALGGQGEHGSGQDGTVVINGEQQ